MALITCEFFAESLGLTSSMNVIIPQPSVGQIGVVSATQKSRYPWILLLHGISDSHTAWMRYTSIERYATAHNLAVVMPCVHRSFYSNMKYGFKYWDFISHDVPNLARLLFPLSEKREETFVAGLSMGGYGAFKLGLRKPEIFSKAASLSGALDIQRLMDTKDPYFDNDFTMIFGDARTARNTPDDLFYCMKEQNTFDPPVEFYQVCGTADFLYNDNKTFLAAAKEHKLALSYSEDPGADHEWGYWDRKIRDVIDFFLKKP